MTEIDLSVPELEPGDLTTGLTRDGENKYYNVPVSDVSNVKEFENWMEKYGFTYGDKEGIDWQALKASKTNLAIYPKSRKVYKNFNNTADGFYAFSHYNHKHLFNIAKDENEPWYVQGLALAGTPVTWFNRQSSRWFKGVTDIVKRPAETLEKYGDVLGDYLIETKIDNPTLKAGLQLFRGRPGAEYLLNKNNENKLKRSKIILREDMDEWNRVENAANDWYFNHFRNNDQLATAYDHHNFLVNNNLTTTRNGITAWNGRKWGKLAQDIASYYLPIANLDGTPKILSFKVMDDYYVPATQKMRDKYPEDWKKAVKYWKKKGKPVNFDLSKNYDGWDQEASLTLRPRTKDITKMKIYSDFVNDELYSDRTEEKTKNYFYSTVAETMVGEKPNKFNSNRGYVTGIGGPGSIKKTLPQVKSTPVSSSPSIGGGGGGTVYPNWRGGYSRYGVGAKWRYSHRRYWRESNERRRAYRRRNFRRYRKNNRKYRKYRYYY